MLLASYLLALFRAILTPPASQTSTSGAQPSAQPSPQTTPGTTAQGTPAPVTTAPTETGQIGLVIESALGGGETQTAGSSTQTPAQIAVAITPPGPAAQSQATAGQAAAGQATAGQAATPAANATASAGPAAAANASANAGSAALTGTQKAASKVSNATAAAILQARLQALAEAQAAAQTAGTPMGEDEITSSLAQILGDLPGLNEAGARAYAEAGVQRARREQLLSRIGAAASSGAGPLEALMMGNETPAAQAAYKLISQIPGAASALDMPLGRR